MIATRDFCKGRRWVKRKLSLKKRKKIKYPNQMKGKKIYIQTEREKILKN